MSLVRIAVRIAACQALRGRTDVGSNVLNSQFGVLDVGADGTIRTDQTKPFLSVYTDAARAGEGDGAPAGSVLTLRNLTVNGATEIVIEAGITAAMVQTNPTTKESQIVGLGTPATDEGFEAQLDMVWRQAAIALTDPDEPWADIFRSLIHRFIRVEKMRASTDQGQRVAAHQIRITAELIDDPLFGEPLDAASPFARFLAAADASEDADLNAWGSKMRELVGGADPDWMSLQRRHGLTREELLATGRGPITQDVDRDTPEHAATDVETAGVGGTVEIVP